MKKLLTTLFVSTLLFTGGVSLAHAQSADLNLTPAVIDEKVEQRDILKESITIKNNSNHVLELYPSVTDINKEVGDVGFNRANDSTALSDSLANWIELSRGMIQLGPGEERAVPFIIHINHNAVANAYHARIIFTEGVTRAEADARAPLGTVAVNVEVKADVKELLQLKKFTTGNVFLSGDDVLFNMQLENIGNQELQPKGHISIYNRSGQEVATLDVNKDSKVVSPEQVTQLASVWSAANGFGRYKALLTVDYGGEQTASVQDTVFFWVVPWKQMLGMFIASLIAIVILALYFHNWLERRHLYKFAHAGLLNEDTLKMIHTSETPVIHIAPEPAPAPAQQKKEHKAEVPKEKGKKRFGIFKRKSATPSAQVATYFEQQLESRREESVPHQHTPLKEVLNKHERPTAHGSAIDLKQLRMQSRAAESHAHTAPTAPAPHKAEVNGHVISLKKKS